MSTVDLAAMFGTSATTVRTIQCERVDDLERGREGRTPFELGIEEKTIGEKRRAVFVDMKRSGAPLIDLLPDNRLATVAAWLKALPYPAMDAHEPYRQAVKRALRHATIVLDRLHVQRAGAAARRHRGARDAWERLAAIWSLQDQDEAERAFDAWETALLPEERVHFETFLRI